MHGKREFHFLGLKPPTDRPDPTNRQTPPTREHHSFRYNSRLMWATSVVNYIESYLSNLMVLTQLLRSMLELQIIGCMTTSDMHNVVLIHQGGNFFLYSSIKNSSQKLLGENSC